MTRHADVPCWLSVGDLADEHGQYEAVPAPLYWIKGNNEGFDAIADGSLPENCRFLANGTLRDVEGLRIAGLGGTFAPSWYDTEPAELPHPRKASARATALADKRRHYVRAEVDACTRLRGVDVFLTHEAPRPFRIGRIDAGKTQISEILTAMQPRLHLFGHHHRFSEGARQGVTSVGLDLVSRSYLIIDSATLAYERQSL